MVEIRRGIGILCFVVRSNLSPNSHRLVFDGTLLGILGSSLQNLIEPNLSTEVAQVIVLLPH